MSFPSAFLSNNFLLGKEDIVKLPSYHQAFSAQHYLYKCVLTQFCHSPLTETLAYQVIVSGKTFDADVQLMNIIKSNLPNIKLVEDNKDHKFTILFCPISSRIGADVTAAMSHIKGEEYYNACKHFYLSLIDLFKIYSIFFTVSQNVLGCCFFYLNI